MDLFVDVETSQFIIKMDGCDEDDDQLMLNLLTCFQYSLNEISSGCSWRNLFSLGIHISGRTKAVSVLQNQVVLDIAEKT